MAKPTTTRRKPAVFGKTALFAAVAASNMLKPEPVPVEELDAVIYVKRMGIGERDEYFAKMKEVPTDKGASLSNAVAFTLAVVDEDGSYLFADDNGEHLATNEDIEAVQKIPPVLIDKALNKFYEVNRFIKLSPQQAQDDADGELKNS